MSDDDLIEYKEYNCTMTQKPDGSWVGKVNERPEVRVEASSVDELRRRMSQELKQLEESENPGAKVEVRTPGPPPGPWVAARDWAVANPWAASASVIGAFGFTALALWLVFNAVFG